MLIQYQGSAAQLRKSQLSSSSLFSLLVLQHALFECRLKWYTNTIF